MRFICEQDIWPILFSETQMTSTPIQSSCMVPRHEIGRIAGRSGLMWRSQILLRTVLDLVGLNPGMLLAVRLDFWNRSRRGTSLMWLSCWHDVPRGRPERWLSLVLPDCPTRLNNDCIVLLWTPACPATMLCTNPASSIPIARRRWFSVRFGIILKSMSLKQKCFSGCQRSTQTFSKP